MEKHLKLVYTLAHLLTDEQKKSHKTNWTTRNNWLIDCEDARETVYRLDWPTKQTVLHVT